LVNAPSIVLLHQIYSLVVNMEPNNDGMLQNNLLDPQTAQDHLKSLCKVMEAKIIHILKDQAVSKALPPRPGNEQTKNFLLLADDLVAHLDPIQTLYDKKALLQNVFEDLKKTHGAANLEGDLDNETVGSTAAVIMSSLEQGRGLLGAYCYLYLALTSASGQPSQRRLGGEFSKLVTALGIKAETDDNAADQAARASAFEEGFKEALRGLENSYLISSIVWYKSMVQFDGTLTEAKAFEAYASAHSKFLTQDDFRYEGKEDIKLYLKKTLGNHLRYRRTWHHTVVDAVVLLHLCAAKMLPWSQAQLAWNWDFIGRCFHVFQDQILSPKGRDESSNCQPQYFGQRLRALIEDAADGEQYPDAEALKHVNKLIDHDKLAHILCVVALEDSFTEGPLFKVDDTVDAWFCHLSLLEGSAYLELRALRNLRFYGGQRIRNMQLHLDLPHECAAAAAAAAAADADADGDGDNQQANNKKRKNNGPSESSAAKRGKHE
jgi:hypothetical protein